MMAIRYVDTRFNDLHDLNSLVEGTEWGQRKSTGEMLGTGKESVWVWECVGKERVQKRKAEMLKTEMLKRNCT
jgi:hypothetical protein